MSPSRRPTRRALVCGLNYPGTPWALSGCVADAQLWGDALSARRFAVTTLTDANATRAAILAELAAMGAQSRPGDCVAYVYSGHGTQLRDADGGDEADHYDEAQCPIDFPDGAYLTDDDLRAVANGCPEGVAFVVFSDSCHSGTITRFAGPGIGQPTRGARRKFIRATPEMHAAHAEFRRETFDVGGTFRVIAGPDSLRSVSFSACQPWEVAYESLKDDGSTTGDFTAVAVPILAAAGANLTRAGFLRRVLAAMGPDRAQSPTLDAAPGIERRALWARTTAAEPTP